MDEETAVAAYEFPGKEGLARGHEATGKGSRIRIALCMGDPAGIGPEIVVKALEELRKTDAYTFLIYGPPSVYARAMKACGLDFDLSEFYPHSNAAGGKHKHEFQWGKCTAWAGNVQKDSLSQALTDARQGLVDAVVFAPFNKHALALAGISGDETEVLRSSFNLPQVRTVTRLDGLMRATVVGHIPFAQISSLITFENLGDTVERVSTFCREFGIETPRIGIAGLNPHSGDQGTLGSDEVEIISPFIKEYSAQNGTDLQGPVPPDVLMPLAQRGDFDAVVYLYHDQGNIAMKAVGFGRGGRILPEYPYRNFDCGAWNGL